MKTSLAIVLATIALTFGAMLSFTSGVSAQNDGNLSGRDGRIHCSDLGAITLAPGPGPYSWQSLGCEMCPAGLSLGGGWLVSQQQRKRKMRKSTTDRMNDYDAVVMGVLEPILVLSVMAVTAFLVRLSW